MTTNERITIDPRICHGKPVIRGTRTPVAIVVGSVAGGMSFDEICREYDLTIEDIRAALIYAGAAITRRTSTPASLSWNCRAPRWSLSS